MCRRRVASTSVGFPPASLRRAACSCSCLARRGACAPCAGRQGRTGRPVMWSKCTSSASAPRDRGDTNSHGRTFRSFAIPCLRTQPPARRKAPIRSRALPLRLVPGCRSQDDRRRQRWPPAPGNAKMLNRSSHSASDQWWKTPGPCSVRRGHTAASPSPASLESPPGHPPGSPRHHDHDTITAT